jgi:hypothetical protein
MVDILSIEFLIFLVISVEITRRKRLRYHWKGVGRGETV